MIKPTLKYSYSERENAEAAAQMLLIAGALMHEWGIDIRKAKKALEAAYNMEQAKHAASTR